MAEGRERPVPAMTVTGARSLELEPPIKVGVIVPPVTVAFHATGSRLLIFHFD